ncbi:MAG: protein kinase [Microcoleaceae cyanobacterium]
MSYCINPDCDAPENQVHHNFCQTCGWSLRLKDRYRIVQLLSPTPAVDRTFLAIDEDQPTQPLCVVKQLCVVNQLNASKDTADASAQKLIVQSPGSLALTSQFQALTTELNQMNQCPGTPQLWASFHQDDYYYLIHEYISGQSLSDTIAAGGHLQEAQVWQLLCDILPVLESMHQQDLVHGDLKPENIIRQSEKQYVLVDLGTAQFTPQAKWNRIQREPLPSGSAEFAAPEQINGRIQPNSDLYSLGVTCIHGLTRMPPFDLLEAPSEQWVWQDYLTRPISSRLEGILDRLIERQPLERYQSVGEVLKDLHRGIGWRRLPRSSKRRWQLVSGIVAAVAGLSLVAASRSLLKRPAIPSTSINPSGMIEPPVNPETRLGLPVSPVAKTLTQSSGPVWAIAVSPNGRTVAAGNTDGTIDILDFQTGRVLDTLPGHSHPVGTVAINHNGQILVSGSGDETIKVWDLWNGRLRHQIDGHEGWIYAVAISPDGKTIASASRDFTVRLWDVQTGKELRRLRGYAEDVQTLTFAPDNRTLVTGGSDGNIELWDWQIGRLLRTFKGHSDSVWAVAVSPDGRTLATGSWDQTVKLWNLPELRSEYFSNVPKHTFNGHQDKVQTLAFSPDGQTLASGDFAGTINLWQVNQESWLETLEGHTAWVDVEFDPQGKALVSGSFDDTIKVWPLH